MVVINYVVSTLSRSGPVNQLFNLIKYLDRTRFLPRVITLSPEGIDTRIGDFRALDIEVGSLDLSRLGGIMMARRYLEAAISGGGEEIVHSHGFRADVLVAHLRGQGKRISTIHNIAKQDYKLTYGAIQGSAMAHLQTRAIRNFDAVVAVSKAVSDYLVIEGKVSSVSVINNGVDADLFYKPGEDEKRSLRQSLPLTMPGRFWVYSGHLSRLKSPYTLLEAWDAYSSKWPQDFLILLGGGDQEKKCRDICRFLPSAHVAGRVPNVSDYLGAADYFVSTSTSEGFPMSVLEGMACGLPVILSNIPAHREILSLSPRCGRSFEVGASDDLASVMGSVRAAEISEMSGASLDIIGAELSARIMARRYEGIYSSITDG